MNLTYATKFIDLSQDKKSTRILERVNLVPEGGDPVFPQNGNCFFGSIYAHDDNWLTAFSPAQEGVQV